MHCACAILACLAVPYLSTLSNKRHDFREKKLSNINCMFYFLYNFVSNISHSRKNRASYYHKCTVHWSSSKGKGVPGQAPRDPGGLGSQNL